MVTLFRKLLIRLGKAIPFVLAFVLSVGYTETVYAIISDNTIIDAEENVIYNLPISFFLADIVYIDWFDVLLVWILCVALELCKYSFRCAYLITLNMPFRWLVENYEISDNVIITCSFTMTLLSLICLYGGIKVVKRLN